jgi:hypothetical protein
MLGRLKHTTMLELKAIRLEAAAAIINPATTARSVMGSFVQGLGARPGIVIVVASGDPQRVLRFQCSSDAANSISVVGNPEVL